MLKGGHNINTDDVNRRFNKRFEDLISILPYCNEATFYDNENGFVTIAKYQNGEIIKVGSQNSLWFQEFLKEFEKTNNVLRDFQNGNPIFFVIQKRDLGENLQGLCYYILI